ncbi:MAG: hypothetical protein WDA37_07135 [Dysgonamonadaceae bacterium]|jgi:hypothetical protein
MKKENHPMKQAFINFLKREGILKLYVKNSNGLAINATLKSKNPKEWISCMFTWYSAEVPYYSIKDGYDFWRDVNLKWQLLLKKLDVEV